VKKLLGSTIITAFILSLFPQGSFAQDTKSVSLYPSADATIVDSDSTVHGSEVTLKCRNDATSSSAFLVKFDLGSVPSNAVIQSASLSLHQSEVDGNVVTLNVYKVTSTWSESTVSGASKPGVDLGVVYGAQSVGSNVGQVTFSQDFSDLVETWISNVSMNYGLYFESTKSADSADYDHTFGSRESVNKPALAITYSVPDEIPPVISDIGITTISQTTAKIGWKTDESSTSFVEYGESSSYGKVAGSGDYTSTHSVSLTDLKPDTKYHFKVVSEDMDGNKSESLEATFKTKMSGEDEDKEEEPKTEENISDEVSPPSNLEVISGIDQDKYYAELKWEHSSTMGIDGYRIYKSEEDSTSYVFLTEIGADKTSYKDGEVEEGKTYFYVVRTVKGDLESRDSNEEVITIYGPDGEPGEKDFSFWKGLLILNLTVWPILGVWYVLNKRKKKQGVNLKFGTVAGPPSKKGKK